MGLNTVRFLSLLFTVLAMAGAFTHLFELRNKMKLSVEDYLTVQQIYQGWWFLGIFEVGALFSTLVLTIIVRNEPKAFVLTLIALFCIVVMQAIFWVFTYPVNQQTNNWTVMSAKWVQLRNQWEYSHASSAVLDLIALITLILSVLVGH